MQKFARADKQMTTANQGKLTITSVCDAVNFKGVYYAPKASKNFVDMKSITDNNCTITLMRMKWSSETNLQARHSSDREASTDYTQSA